MAGSGQPIEKLYVDIEANIATLLQQTADGVDQVEQNLEDVDQAAEETESRFKGIRDMAGKVADVAKMAARALIAMAAAVAAAFKVASDSVRGMRVELAFRMMAARAQQSSDEILAAMRRASLGVIDDMELMRQANTALMLGVAKTPEEFERLTRSAIVLGRAVGRDAADSLEFLITAAGRRSVQVLDNLGISLAAVNAELDKLAQAEFGVAADQLTQVQRSMLFMKATLQVANRQAEALGGNMGDVGTKSEQAMASFAVLKQELGEILAMLFSFAGAGGLMDHMIQGARDWQRIIVAGMAYLQAGFFTLRAMAEAIKRGRWEMTLGDFGQIFDQLLDAAFADFGDRFEQVLDPEAYAERIAGAMPPVSPLEPVLDAMEQDALDIEALLDRLAGSMIDAAADLQRRLAELWVKHQDRLREIDERGAERRQAIIDRHGDQLARVRQDMADAEADYRRDQEREEEEHQRDLARLRERHREDLQSAIARRDARAIVDLIRRYRREKRERTEDHRTQRRDATEDHREAQARRARREREVRESLARELLEHDRAQARLRAKEEQSYRQRARELNRALQERLRAIARELADEERINEAGARRILLALKKTFGVGGSIDRLMDDFVKRRRQKMVVRVSFERDAPRPTLEEVESQAMGLSSASPMAALPQMGPTMPVAQAGGGLLESRVNVHFSGSAPPGIRSADRDQIAGVLIQALREAGVMQ